MRQTKSRRNRRGRFRGQEMLVLLLAAGLATAACEKADPTFINDQVNGFIRQNLDGLAKAVTVVDELGAPRAVADWAAGDVEKRQGDEEWIGGEAERIAKEIADWLEEHIFTEENIEKIDRDKITYRLRADALCSYEDYTGETRMDEDCEKILTEAPIRMVVSWSKGKERIDLEVHVGDEPRRPFDLRLEAELVSIVADLAEVVGVAKTVAELLDDDDFSVPFAITGKVGVALRAEADGGYSLTYSVEEGVDFSTGPRTAHDHVRVQLDKAEAAVKKTFSSSGVGFSLGLSSIDVAVARDLVMGDRGYWECGHGDECWVCQDDEGEGEHCVWVCDCHYVEPETRLTGVFDVQLPGLHGAVVTSVDDDSLKLEGLGVGDGPMSISFNSLPIFVFDLNEEDGRSFDLGIDFDGRDVLLEFGPSISWRLAHDLTAFLEDYEWIPAWLLGGFTSMSLGEAATPTLRILNRDWAGGECEWICEGEEHECWDCYEAWCDWICDGDPCAECDDPADCPDTCVPPCRSVCEADEISPLQVVEGKLTLDASDLEAPIEVLAGQCVVASWEADYDEDDHPFVMLSAGVCIE